VLSRVEAVIARNVVLLALRNSFSPSRKTCAEHPVTFDAEIVLLLAGFDNRETVTGNGYQGDFKT
jgi:hypothetical protein